MMKVSYGFIFFIASAALVHKVVADDACPQMVDRIGYRIFRTVEITEQSEHDIPKFLKHLDYVFSYIDESIYTEFDHMVRSVTHYHDNSNNKQSGNKVSIDITDEYVTFLRNEIVSQFYKYWNQIRGMIPSTIYGMPMFILTSKTEVLRLVVKILTTLNETCFWVPFLIPIIDEAMNLDPSIWEERKLREAFETAFKATGFINTVDKYNVVQPTYPVETQHSSGSSLVSDTVSLKSPSHAASWRGNFSFNFKSKVEIKNENEDFDPIKETEDAFLTQRHFESEWSQFTAYMEQFRAFLPSE